MSIRRRIYRSGNSLVISLPFYLLHSVNFDPKLPVYLDTLLGHYIVISNEPFSSTTLDPHFLPRVPP